MMLEVDVDFIINYIVIHMCMLYLNYFFWFEIHTASPPILSFFLSWVSKTQPNHCTFFWFLVCSAATQLATPLHQTETHTSPLEITIDLPIGFPINNIISHIQVD